MNRLCSLGLDSNVRHVPDVINDCVRKLALVDEKDIVKVQVIPEYHLKKTVFTNQDIAMLSFSQCLILSWGAPKGGFQNQRRD